MAHDDAQSLGVASGDRVKRELEERRRSGPAWSTGGCGPGVVGLATAGRMWARRLAAADPDREPADA